MARAVEPPTSARDLLDRVDNSDAHRVRTTTPGTARRAMQRAIDWSPRLIWLARVAHRGLRLHIVRPDADHPLGWSILSGTDRRLVMATHGPLFTMRIQIEVGAEFVTASTAIRFERRSAAPIWAVVAPVHRLVLRRLVDASV